MFIVYGSKQARIKHAQDNTNKCNQCESVDLEYSVHKDYFHLFWIPMFPVSRNQVSVLCKGCGNTNANIPRVEHYRAITRTPIYLWSGLILVAGLIVFLVIDDGRKTEERAMFVAKPEVGDVYTMKNVRNDTTAYSFLRVSRINGDSVFVYQNILEYYGLVSKLDPADHFIEEELFLFKPQLKEFLDKGDIHSVSRGYSDYEGYNRTEKASF